MVWVIKYCLRVLSFVNLVPTVQFLDPCNTLNYKFSLFCWIAQYIFLFNLFIFILFFSSNSFFDLWNRKECKVTWDVNGKENWVFQKVVVMIVSKIDCCFLLFMGQIIVTYARHLVYSTKFVSIMSDKWFFFKSKNSNI